MLELLWLLFIMYVIYIIIRNAIRGVKSIIQFGWVGRKKLKERKRRA